MGWKFLSLQILQNPLKIKRVFLNIFDFLIILNQIKFVGSVLLLATVIMRKLETVMKLLIIITNYDCI